MTTHFDEYNLLDNREMQIKDDMTTQKTTQKNETTTQNVNVA